MAVEVTVDQPQRLSDLIRLSAPSPAPAQSRFRNVVVFGDSLSDVGRTLTTGHTDDAGQELKYFNRRSVVVLGWCDTRLTLWSSGCISANISSNLQVSICRYSDGPIWVDYVCEHLKIPLPTEDNVHAYGSATTDAVWCQVSV